MSYFRLVRADRFDVLLVKHNVIRPSREVENALMGSGHSMKDAQRQSPLLTQLRRCLVRRKIFDEDRAVMDAASKFSWERVERLLDNLGESFAVHFPVTCYQARAMIPIASMRPSLT